MGWAYSGLAFGFGGLGWSLLGTVVGLLLLLPAYAVGGMGAGDVKLLAGVGAWMFPMLEATHVPTSPTTAMLYSFAVSAIVGAILAFGRPLTFVNTNGLVRNSRWDIELSKTGYISEAGRCLVMQVRVASKDLIVVLLDSWGKQSRIGDAQRISKWLETATNT